MLNPNSSRAFVEGNSHELSISIPAKQNLFVLLFLLFWLGGWAMGELFALRMLSTLPFGFAYLFILFWCAFWTLGGLAAGVAFLWVLLGKEHIHLTKEKVTVKRQIPYWTRKTECHSDQISGLKMTFPKIGPQRKQKGLQSILSDRKEGVISFTYGVHTIGFGLDLDPSEAGQILALILERFPEFGKAP